MMLYVLSGSVDWNGGLENTCVCVHTHKKSCELGVYDMSVCVCEFVSTGNESGT